MPSINFPNFRPNAADIDVLRDLVRFGWMTTEQIGRRYGLPFVPCTARLTRLRHNGLVVWNREFRISPLYLATYRGAKYAGLTLRAVRQVDENDVYHDLAAVDVADYLLDHEPGSRWVSEREYKSRAFRRARRFGAQLPGRFPDGILVDRAGRCIAIEVELHKKDASRYRKILREYAALFEFDAVRWYVAAPSIRTLLDTAIRDTAYPVQEMAVLSLPPGVGQRR